MKKQFQIKEACQQRWDDMLEVANGKHCDVCNKKVWDLDKLSESEIHEITESNDSICGKKSFIKPAFSTFLLVLTLTSVTNIHAQNENKSLIENIHQNEIEIKVKLVSKEKRKLVSGEISLVTLEKLYSAKADEKGNFTLKFPEKILSEYNIIRIDYTVLEANNKEFTDYKSSIFGTTELLGKENFEIEERYVTIGAVVITNPKPPDFYYLDGKKIAKRKFEKLKKEFPDYKYLAFYDEVTVQKLTKKSFVDNLYLLYSK